VCGGGKAWGARFNQIKEGEASEESKGKKNKKKSHEWESFFLGGPGGFKKTYELLEDRGGLSPARSTISLRWRKKTTGHITGKESYCSPPWAEGGSRTPPEKHFHKEETV